MKVDWAVLANSAEVREGVAYLMSAGWDVARRDRYPSKFVGAVAARLLFNRTEAGHHTYELQMLTQDGNPISPAVVVPVEVAPSDALPAGWDIASVVAVNLSGFVLPAPGVYVIDLLVDRFHVKSLPFRAIRTGM